MPPHRSPPRTSKPAGLATQQGGHTNPILLSSSSPSARTTVQQPEPRLPAHPPGSTPLHPPTKSIHGSSTPARPSGSTLSRNPPSSNTTAPRAPPQEPIEVDSTNFMKLANVDTTIPATQTAAEILNARFASIFDSRDGLYRNARARDSLLLGWKFARLLGRGAHAIASLWTYKPADDEKLLNWPGENDIHPVQNLVIKQAEGVRESLAEEGKKLQVFTRLGCNHFPKIYDVVHKLQGKTRIDRIFMEYFPNGSLANYMQQYQEMIPMSPQGLKDWQTNPRYGYRNKSGEEPRISEKALWSLFLCLAKSVLAAETGREHIVNFDEDQMHGLVFVPLDLKPDNVLVAAQTDDLEHKYFPRVVWTDFALSLFAPIDWKKLSEKDRREERWRLENTFPGGMIGDYLFMAPEQKANEYEKIGTCTNVWLVGALMWWCIELCPLPERYPDDEDRDPDVIFDGILDLSHHKVMKHTVYSEELRKLICNCLQLSPDARPNAHDLLRKTISGLCKTAKEELATAYKNTSTPLPQMKLLVPRLKAEYDYYQQVKKEVNEARRQFKHFTGKDFKGNSPMVTKMRFLKSGKNIADEAEDWLADGLVFDNDEATDEVPPPENDASNSVQIVQSDRRPNNLVHLRMWPAAVRVESSTTKPWVVTYSYKEDSTIKDLKAAVKRVRQGKTDTWLKDAIVHIYPHDDERHLNNTYLISDLACNNDKGWVGLDCICISRKAKAFTLKKPDRDSYYVDKPLESDPGWYRKRTKRWEKDMREYIKASKIAPQKGDIDVSQPYNLRIFLWPKSGRTKGNVHLVNEIMLTQYVPWKTNVKDIRGKLEEILKSKYEITLNDNESIRLYESGPFNAIHLGAKKPLQNQHMISHIVLSREQQANGDLVVRNLDAVIYTTQQSKTKRKADEVVEIDDSPPNKIPKTEKK